MVLCHSSARPRYPTCEHRRLRLCAIDEDWWTLSGSTCFCRNGQKAQPRYQQGWAKLEVQVDSHATYRTRGAGSQRVRTAAKL